MCSLSCLPIFVCLLVYLSVLFVQCCSGRWFHVINVSWLFVSAQKMFCRCLREEEDVCDILHADTLRACLGVRSMRSMASGDVFLWAQIAVRRMLSCLKDTKVSTATVQRFPADSLFLTYNSKQILQLRVPKIANGFLRTLLSSLKHLSVQRYTWERSDGLCSEASTST